MKSSQELNIVLTIWLPSTLFKFKPNLNGKDNHKGTGKKIGITITWS